MTVKRTKLEVVRDILRAINDKNGRIRPTHILYKANLSHQMLDEYLTDLINRGLVVETKVGNSRTYALTDKGFEFLRKYKMISEFVDSFGLG